MWQADIGQALLKPSGETNVVEHAVTEQITVQIVHRQRRYIVPEIPSVKEGNAQAYAVIAAPSQADFIALNEHQVFIQDTWALPMI